LLKNADIARSEDVPMCQDTGFAVVFVELGQDVHIEGGALEDAINEGVRRGYTEGYLRKSIVGHPLERVNTGDNTPAVIHLKLVPGNKMKITVAPKGGGSENMSGIKMLKPAEGVEGVKKFVLDTVKAAGPNPCPPIIVGVGIGGTFEKCALLAKEALLRPVGTPSHRPEIARLERELLDEINSTGIGPQGLGGRFTALAVHIEIYPVHIASLPVAVNINCHASRHKEIVL
jgi:fumarate hydratase subunit alpha